MPVHPIHGRLVDCNGIEVYPYTKNHTTPPGDVIYVDEENGFVELSWHDPENNYEAVVEVEAVEASRLPLKFVPYDSV